MFEVTGNGYWSKKYLSLTLYKMYGAARACRFYKPDNIWYQLLHSMFDGINSLHNVSHVAGLCKLSARGQFEYGMTKPQKECFGILDRVFPMGKEGLREIVPTCFDCPDKQACLQEALNTEQGFRFRNEVMDRSPARGLAGRFKRWSEKKDLNRRLKHKKGKKK